MTLILSFAKYYVYLQIISYILCMSQKDDVIEVVKKAVGDVVDISNVQLLIECGLISDLNCIKYSVKYDFKEAKEKTELMRYEIIKDLSNKYCVSIYSIREYLKDDRVKLSDEIQPEENYKY